VCEKMTKQCKKGFKKVEGVCIRNKTNKILGTLTDEYAIAKIALITALTSIGGWALFTGILRLLRIEDVAWWVLLIIGLVLTIATAKFGWSKIVK